MGINKTAWLFHKRKLSLTLMDTVLMPACIKSFNLYERTEEVIKVVKKNWWIRGGGV